MLHEPYSKQSDLVVSAPRQAQSKPKAKPGACILQQLDARSIIKGLARLKQAGHVQDIVFGATAVRGSHLRLAAGALRPCAAHVGAHEAGDAGEATLRLAHVADVAHNRAAVALAVAQ